MNKIILFSYPLLEKIWGSDYFKKHGISDNAFIGEMWSMSGLHSNTSVAINTEYKGKTLEELYQNNKELFGNEQKGAFPILVKLITTSDKLSIQVHPDDEYANKYENGVGKTEGWLILDTTDKSNIIIGHKLNSYDDIVKMIDNKTYDTDLNYVYPKVGDFYPIPSKTIHGLGPDLVLLEIQQSSDITYRFYDYDRKDKNGNLRELHVKKALDVVSVEPYKETIHNVFNEDIKTIWNNQYFSVDLVNVNDKLDIITNKNEYLIGSVVSGDINIDNHKLIIGESFIVPSNTKDCIYGNGKIVLTKSK